VFFRKVRKLKAAETGMGESGKKEKEKAISFFNLHTLTLRKAPLGVIVF
jgi:hypothetical protein